MGAGYTSNWQNKKKKRWARGGAPTVWNKTQWCWSALQKKNSIVKYEKLAWCREKKQKNKQKTTGYQTWILAGKWLTTKTVISCPQCQWEIKCEWIIALNVTFIHRSFYSLYKSSSSSQLNHCRNSHQIHSQPCKIALDFQVLEIRQVFAFQTIIIIIIIIIL